MPIDLSGNIDRFEADDLRQFTYVDTVSVPASITFTLYGPNGSIVDPVAVQSGITVTPSGSAASGMYYIFRQLPSSRGFYTGEWKAFGSGTIQSSLYVTNRFTFEIVKTEPRSFFSYGSKNNVMRIARQLIGRGDLTEYDIQPHMEAAHGYINARLGGVTTVPFSPAPAYIAQGEEIIAVYTLYGTFGGTEKNEIPPAFQKLRDDFVAFLDKAAEGLLTVDGIWPIEQGAITYFTGGIEGGKPTFGRSDWPYQVIDILITEKEADDYFGGGV